MTLHSKIRRLVALRSSLLAISGVCLGLSLAAVVPSSSVAQSNSLTHSNSSLNQNSSGMLSTNHTGLHDRALGSSLVSPAHVPHASLQLGLGGRWWDDHKTVKKLNLTPGQQQRMDSIFEANKPALMTLYSNLQREQARLATIPPGDLQDETKIFAAIDRVAQARSDLEKENVHMLLQVRQQLDPQQLQSLDDQISKQQ